MAIKLIRSLQNNPTTIFIVDGIGALLTAFSLGFILVRFEEVFGIPSQALYKLAVIPIIYLGFDIFSYQQGQKHVGRNLTILAVLNLIYCCISLGIGIYHFQVLKIWGWLYIFNEIIIIVILSMFEIRVGREERAKHKVG